MNELMAQLRAEQLKLLEKQTNLLTDNINENLFRLPRLNQTYTQFDTHDVMTQAELLVEKMDYFASENASIGLQIDEIVAYLRQKNGVGPEQPEVYALKDERPASLSTISVEDGHYGAAAK